MSVSSEDPPGTAAVESELDQAREALSDAEGALDADLSAAVVINRCYYACFHAAQAVLYDRGFDPNPTPAFCRCSAPKSWWRGTRPATRDGS